MPNARVRHHQTVAKPKGRQQTYAKAYSNYTPERGTTNLG